MVMQGMSESMIGTGPLCKPVLTIHGKINKINTFEFDFNKSENKF